MAAMTVSAYAGSPADSSAPGRSTATVSWPRARSSGTTRCQYHAAPPAPGMRTNMLTEASVLGCHVYDGPEEPESPAAVPGPLISRNGTSAGVVLAPVRHEQRHGFLTSAVLQEQGHAFPGDGYGDADRDDKQRAEAEP